MCAGTVSDPAPQGSMYQIPNPITCQGAACVRSTFVRCNSPDLDDLAQGKCGGCNGPIGAVFYSGAQGNFIVQANGQDGCINQYSGKSASNASREGMSKVAVMPGTHAQPDLISKWLDASCLL